MAEYERVGLVKGEVFVYRIPPLGTNRGYRAADWKLDEPDWTGRLRVVSIGKKCEIRLEDRTSGELFAKCPIDKYPGPAVESVSDSSRYFVIRLLNDNGQSASIGIGFADRGDSFDLNVALQDHFKYVKAEENQAQTEAAEAAKPKLDLGFKEGQTITINLGGKKDGARSRPRPGGGGAGPVPLLPPPPGSSSSRGIAPPPSSNLPPVAPAAGIGPSPFQTNQAPSSSNNNTPAGSHMNDLFQQQQSTFFNNNNTANKPT